MRICPIVLTIPDDILGLDNGEFESRLSVRAFGEDLTETHYLAYRIIGVLSEFSVAIEVSAAPDDE